MVPTSASDHLLVGDFSGLSTTILPFSSRSPTQHFWGVFFFFPIWLWKCLILDRRTLSHPSVVCSTVQEVRAVSQGNCHRRLHCSIIVIFIQLYQSALASGSLGTPHRPAPHPPPLPRSVSYDKKTRQILRKIDKLSSLVFAFRKRCASSCSRSRVKLRLDFRSQLCWPMKTLQ